MMNWSSDEKNIFAEMYLSTADLYGKKITERSVLLTINWLETDEISFEQAIKALRAHCMSGDQNSSFFPKPADLKRMAHGMPEDCIENALLEVRNGLERHGVETSVTFQDKMINSAIDKLGGWLRLGDMNETEFSFWANSFRKIYRNMLQTRRAPYVEYLPGRDHSNRLIGRADVIKTPTVLGEKPHHALKIEFYRKDDVFPSGLIVDLSLDDYSIDPKEITGPDEDE